MNKHILSIALLISIVPAPLIVADQHSILPGGCVRPHNSEVRLSLAEHKIEVKVGQEFYIDADFGIESFIAGSWDLVSIPREVELVAEVILKRNPPIKVWTFLALEEGNYIISFENKHTHDVINVHITAFLGHPKHI